MNNVVVVENEPQYHFVKEGTVVMLTTGEYSDYSFSGPFRALRDFNIKEVKDLYVASYVPTTKKTYDRPDTYGFEAYLASEGYLIDIEGSMSFHLGDYGVLEVE